MVRVLLERESDVRALTLDDWRDYSELFGEDVLEVTARRSVEARKTPQSTAPAAVAAALADARGLAEDALTLPMLLPPPPDGPPTPRLKRCGFCNIRPGRSLRCDASAHSPPCRDSGHPQTGHAGLPREAAARVERGHPRRRWREPRLTDTAPRLPIRSGPSSSTPEAAHRRRPHGPASMSIMHGPDDVGRRLDVDARFESPRGPQPFAVIAVYANRARSTLRARSEEPSGDRQILQGPAPVVVQSPDGLDVDVRRAGAHRFDEPAGGVAARCRFVAAIHASRIGRRSGATGQTPGAASCARDSDPPRLRRESGAEALLVGAFARRPGRPDCGEERRDRGIVGANAGASPSPETRRRPVDADGPAWMSWRRTGRRVAAALTRR